MSTWEERMSDRAKGRQVIAEAEGVAREAAEQQRLRAGNPPVHEDEDGPITWLPEHLGHYRHRRPVHGSGVVCSCGATLAWESVVLLGGDPQPFDYCDICDLRGLSPQ